MSFFLPVGCCQKLPKIPWHFAFILETLRSKFFGIAPAVTANVKNSRDQCPVVRIWVWGSHFYSMSTLKGYNKWFTARVLHPKTSQSCVWEEILCFLELFCLLIIQFVLIGAYFWRQFLSWNSLPFAVRWPNLDLKVSILDFNLTEIQFSRRT